MKKLILLGGLSLLILHSYGCGRSDKETPVESVPIGISTPDTPINPGPAPGNNANNDNLQLSPLPASGVPLGFASWDELNSVDPATRSLETLDGRDPSQELLGENPFCSVYVLAAYLDDQGLPNYILRSSFKHNSDTHTWVRMTVAKDSTQIIGTGSNGKDQIFLKLERPGDLLSASRMNLKWFHINHFDVGVCEDLKLRTQS